MVYLPTSVLRVKNTLNHVFSITDDGKMTEFRSILAFATCLCLMCVSSMDRQQKKHLRTKLPFSPAHSAESEVYPEERFWMEMKKRGWNTSSPGGIKNDKMSNGRL